MTLFVISQTYVNISIYSNICSFKYADKMFLKKILHLHINEYKLVFCLNKLRLFMRVFSTKIKSKKTIKKYRYVNE